MIPNRNRLGLASGNVQYRSQLVAYVYFVMSAILFLFQVLFGLLIAWQYVWPTFLMDSFAFNIGRETHLNLLIFWLLLGLMGAAYYLIPEETESELFSVPLAYLQLGVMSIATLGTLLSFWFMRTSLGKPFTEAPQPWPLLIAFGVVLFLGNIGITILCSRKWTAISLVLFGGMAALAAIYLIDFTTSDNLTVDFYWWWWIIHLWVEGAWELIAGAIMAYLLIKLTGADRRRMSRWLYVQVSLTTFTGIIGIGHHYYWIGTPDYWLLWGAIFSALEPVPIALMVYDALRNMAQRKVEPTNRIAVFWLGGSAIGHLVGAGVWGFAQTLPAINQWTHGTQITAAHGHFAFFGAFGMLVLAAIYFMVPQMKGLKRIQETRGLWGFWLMSIGMLTMVATLTFAGVVQTYLFRVLGLDFIVVRDQYLQFWLFWRFTFGALLFLPGLLVYLWDLFSLSAPRRAPALATAAGK